MYYKDIERKVKVAYSIAKEARGKGLDPVDKVEIPLATDLPERVTGLVSTAIPQMKDERIEKRIRQLEKEHGFLNPAVAFLIADEIASEKYSKFTNKLEAIEAGIRIGFAYLTLGSVSSPLEGFTRINLKKGKYGEVFSVYYSGPIRSAGGTAAALSVVLIDYLRERFGYEKYEAKEEEIKRAVTEVYDYHERITNLQYLPSEKEIEVLIKHLPLQLNGDPTEVFEVSNYKIIENVETPKLRGGFCLIIGECLTQKAAKVLGIIEELKKKGIVLKGWEFLEKISAVQKKKKAGVESKEAAYIKDLVAGRPIFGHPSMNGAFRLRYGKTRASGFSSTAINPISSYLLNEFIAIGTQLRTERPGKSAAITFCDSIEPPIVKLDTGSVVQPKSIEEAKKISNRVKEILYLGDVLVSYGDFYNRNHPLVPCGYNEEYWQAELKDKNIKTIEKPTLEEAIKLSEKEHLPLYPLFIFYWRSINNFQLRELLKWILKAKINEEIILPLKGHDEAKRALELIGCQHLTIADKVVIKEDANALLYNLGILNLKEGMQEKIEQAINNIDKSQEDSLSIINSLCASKIRDKCGNFIGSRMGRPEKAKPRKLTGQPNVLFPVGSQGGRLRSFQEAIQNGKVIADFPIYYCDECGEETIYYICEKCNKATKRMSFCDECKQRVEGKCTRHGKTNLYTMKAVDIKHYFESAKKKLNFTDAEMPALVKGVRGTSSASHTVENLAKGILRAIFGLSVNKDGTIRADLTELPLTHFKPKEIGTSIEKLKDLGYTKDVDGKELKEENQILELKPHDILLPLCPESLEERVDELFVRTAAFIDNLLVRFYNLRPFYNIKSRDDLVGHLVVGLSPHTSVGVVARIIGFSSIQALYAHPLWHSALRRDCLASDTFVPIQENGEWEIVRVGEFIESLNPTEKADLYGTLKKKTSQLNTISLGNSVDVCKIKEATKHTPSKLILIETEAGKKIKTTLNHRFYVFENGKVIEKVASELKKGDKLISQYKISIPEKDVESINLLEKFKGKDYIHIRKIKNLHLEIIKRAIKKGMKRRALENFITRDSFPLVLLEKLDLVKNIPESAKIAIKRDTVEIPIKIPLKIDLLEILGLYLAEGYARKNETKKGFYQVSISTIDKKLREFIEKIFWKSFKVKPTEKDEEHLTFSSRILYELFIDILCLGKGARTKRFPQRFLNLKKEKVAAILRGYYEGDGSVSLTDKRVTCDTISKGLLADLEFLLARFGIFAKFYEYEKEPGLKVREFYEKKGKIPKFKITKLIVLSDFCEEFRKSIGFLSKRKKEILNKICQKKTFGARLDFDKNACLAFLKVKNIKKASIEPTYCFNVENTHNFFANNLLVHNCDGDEAALMLLLDCLINFSHYYLPAHRGSTQDAPLILNARIKATEVDDMAFDIETCKEYPLDLYRKAENFASPREIKIPQIRDLLDGEVKGLKYTHETNNINLGVTCSAYKRLETMQDKVDKQMEVAEKIRAVDESDVARLIIERHFIRDIKGNLRKFSSQQFRCSKCNSKFRRPPLVGKCIFCGGKIIFTVSEGGIVKYLDSALNLAENYNVDPYVKQNLELLKRGIESVFGREKEKQVALQQWMG